MHTYICVYICIHTNVYIYTYIYVHTGVIKSYEDSLQRLGVETVYGLRLHDCESDIHIDAVLSR
jgi:aryl-alcohol dehydrogenase-like predicted oxidoreductase